MAKTPGLMTQKRATGTMGFKKMSTLDDEQRTSSTSKLSKPGFLRSATDNFSEKLSMLRTSGQSHLKRGLTLLRSTKNLGDQPTVDIEISISKRKARKTMGKMVEPLKKASAVTCLVTTSYAVIAGHDCGVIYVWDATSAANSPLYRFRAHNGPLRSMHLVSQLDVIATTSTDRVMKVWSVSTLELQQSLGVPCASDMLSQCFSGLLDAKRGLLVLGSDRKQCGLLQIWDTSSKSGRSR